MLTEDSVCLGEDKKGIRQIFMDSNRKDEGEFRNDAESHHYRHPHIARTVYQLCSRNIILTL